MITKKQKVRIVILVIILVAAILGGAYAISSQLGGTELPWEVISASKDTLDSASDKPDELVEQDAVSQKTEEKVQATEVAEPDDAIEADDDQVADSNAEPGQDVAADTSKEAANKQDDVAIDTSAEALSDQEDKATDAAEADTSVTATGAHFSFGGALSVNEDGKLIDEEGDEIRLIGISSHGLSWYSEYITEDSIAYMRDNWGINCLRLAVYPSDYNGYCVGGAEVQAAIMDTIATAVEAAVSSDMYIIIDWHVLNEQTPLEYKSEAIQFFGQLARDFSDLDNVIYEICNEPNGDTTWAEVKKYAKEVIPVIREVDKDALILVGSPDYSSDLTDVMADPLDFDNIMYTYHFYASSHGTRARSVLMDALDEGLPVFISEFAFTEADGDGSINEKDAAKWVEIIDEYGLSACLWNLSNKDEASSVIAGDCDKLTDWTYDDLSAQGQYAFDLLAAHLDVDVTKEDVAAEETEADADTEDAEEITEDTSKTDKTSKTHKTTKTDKTTKTNKTDKSTKTDKSNKN